MCRRLTSCGVAVLALTFMTPGCSRAGSESSGAPPTAARNRSGAAAQTRSGAPAEAIRLKPYRCVDSQGLGIEAFSVLVPAEWRFEGGIFWRRDNPAFPAYASCRISSPDGATAFEVFPNLPYFWTDNPMVAGLFAPGSKYFGNIVRHPIGAAQALRDLVVPAYRGQAEKLEIAEGEAVPALAAMVRSMQARMQPEANIQADAAKIRILYRAGGHELEEEMYAVVQLFAVPLRTMAGTVTNQNWWVDYIFSCRAARGQLDRSAKLLQTIAYSFRVEPRWFAGYSNVVAYLIRQQIQQIRTIGEIGRIYAQTGSEIRDDQMRSWEANQAIRDRMSKEWSQGFRGVEEYYDPFAEKSVELPSGYANAWVTPLGEVVVSNDPSFNPNIGSNQTWQPMKKN